MEGGNGEQGSIVHLNLEFYKKKKKKQAQSCVRNQDLGFGAEFYPAFFLGSEFVFYCTGVGTMFLLVPW